MSRKHYATDEAYKRQKANDYRNRYIATQRYMKRKWSEEEKTFLIKNGNAISERELSEILQRSICAVEKQKARLRDKGLMEYPQQGT